jgi:hypothetical protein
VRTLLVLLAGVGAISLLSAGPLDSAAAGPEVPAGQIAGQEMAKLLLIETIEDDEERWHPDRLRGFVDDLGVDRAQELGVEVVDDQHGPALAVTINALGTTEEACVVADEGGLPVSEQRPCR